ncbi:hypothetical protein COEREDRAFT_89369 [Coemansia reversa NRRL 1564]|uniref:Uncharacterized protein n=1 Tax=Coemansia reversa (strain ATCC 12441 / NRRL 1564) TaxID=763665 RepID=A0A2G5B3W2_COERN|nr:hypothetical protein COEREDRAFT_89369 [Coemansia reversa NRRL 1564]|eukprot:PIA13733.1 hypothetical protein COEREDRAFT_89369 [Coemansia reversa NRRL 1564]
MDSNGVDFSSEKEAVDMPEFAPASEEVKDNLPNFKPPLEMETVDFSGLDGNWYAVKRTIVIILFQYQGGKKVTIDFDKKITDQDDLEMHLECRTSLFGLHLAYIPNSSRSTIEGAAYYEYYAYQPLIKTNRNAVIYPSRYDLNEYVKTYIYKHITKVVDNTYARILNPRINAFNIDGDISYTDSLVYEQLETIVDILTRNLDEMEPTIKDNFLHPYS